VERRKITLQFESKLAKFQDLPMLDFDRLYSKKVTIDMMVGNKISKINVIIDLQELGDYKQLTISSDL
jgi:hypothetical protein